MTNLDIEERYPFEVLNDKILLKSAISKYFHCQGIEHLAGIRDIFGRRSDTTVLLSQRSCLKISRNMLERNMRKMQGDCL